jgi:hypothetical protein
MGLTLRDDVQEFIRARDTLTRFAQQHNGLTEEEREIVVVNFVRALEQEIAPSHPLKDFVLSHPQPDQGNAPLGTPLANMPLID